MFAVAFVISLYVGINFGRKSRLQSKLYDRQRSITKCPAPCIQHIHLLRVYMKYVCAATLPSRLAVCVFAYMFCRCSHSVCCRRRRGLRFRFQSINLTCV